MWSQKSWFGETACLRDGNKKNTLDVIAIVVVIVIVIVIVIVSLGLIKKWENLPFFLTRIITDQMISYCRNFDVCVRENLLSEAIPRMTFKTGPKPQETFEKNPRNIWKRSLGFDAWSQWKWITLSARNKQISENDEEIRVFYCSAR